MSDNISSSYAELCQQGRSQADYLLQAMRRDQNPVLLGACVRQVAEAGKFGPVEVGLFGRLSECLIAAK